MTILFRDDILGSFAVRNVINIEHVRDNIWSITTEDYESEEIEGEIVEISMEAV